MNYAGFWWRVLAYFIDSIVLSIVYTLLVSYLTLVTQNVNGSVAFGNMANLVITFIYFTCLESSEWQGTLGKQICGLQVTNLDGNRISYRVAVLRHIGKIISALILCIGFLMVAFTEKKQGLHDKLARTFVVKIG
jgi:uncharacterized RDD family membrane protein YckC